MKLSRRESSIKNHKINASQLKITPDLKSFYYTITVSTTKWSGKLSKLNGTFIGILLSTGKQKLYVNCNIIFVFDDK